MRVEIKEGGDGVRCWNAEAIQTYAAARTGNERRIAGANPDVVVLEGLIRCYGCEVQEYHYGTKCTAILTKTRFAVQGELEPRAEDAAGSLLEIEGLATTEPGSRGLGSFNAATEPETIPSAAPAPDPSAPDASGTDPSGTDPSGTDPSAVGSVPAAERRVAPEPPDREPRRNGLRGLFGGR